LSVEYVAFNPGGKKVLTGSSDGMARPWSVDPTDVRALLWQKTAFCLSVEQRQRVLGEPAGEAATGSAKCRDTVERCRAGFDSCRRVVAAAYGEVRETEPPSIAAGRASEDNPSDSTLGPGS
jgi:hypothetical protein